MNICKLPQGTFSISVLKLDDSMSDLINVCIMRGWCDKSFYREAEECLVLNKNGARQGSSAYFIISLVCDGGKIRKYISVKISDAEVYKEAYSILRLKFMVRSEELNLSISKQCLNVVERVPEKDIKIDKIVNDAEFRRMYLKHQTAYRENFAFNPPEKVSCVCVLSAAGANSLSSCGSVIQNLVNPNEGAFFSVSSFGKNGVRSILVSNRIFSNDTDGVVRAIGSIAEHTGGHCEVDPFRNVLAEFQRIAESKEELGLKIDLRLGIVFISDDMYSFSFEKKGYCFKRHMLGLNVYSMSVGADNTISNCSELDTFKKRMNLI